MKGDKRIKELKEISLKWWEIDTDAYKNNPYIDAKTYLFQLEDETFVIARQVYGYVLNEQYYDSILLTSNDIKKLYQIIQTQIKQNH